MYQEKKFNIKKWVGRYQSHLVYLYGGRKLKVNSYGLEKFFGYFPKARYLHEFSVFDVADYMKYRREEGASDGGIKWEVRSIRRFYSWLINHCNYPYPNPALAHSPLPGGVEKKSLRLEDLRRILSACDNPLTKDFVLGLILGDVRLNGKTWTWHATRLRQAHERCGLYWIKLSKSRQLIQDGLWATIIRHNSDKLRDAFLSEAELNSSLFRDIQVPSGNIRPPVSDSDLDFFLCPEVLKPEPSAESQAPASTSK